MADTNKDEPHIAEFSHNRIAPHVSIRTRRFRLLEYIGDASWVDATFNNRVVKGLFTAAPGRYVYEHNTTEIELLPHELIMGQQSSDQEVATRLIERQYRSHHEFDIVRDRERSYLLVHMDTDRCLFNLRPGEPIFVLRAQDISSVHTIMHWLHSNRSNLSIERAAQVDERIIRFMDWQRKNRQFVKRAD